MPAGGIGNLELAKIGGEKFPCSRVGAIFQLLALSGRRNFERQMIGLQRRQDVVCVEYRPGSVRSRVSKPMGEKTLNDLADKRRGKGVEIPPTRDGPSTFSFAACYDIDDKALRRSASLIRRLRSGSRCIPNIAQGDSAQVGVKL